MSATGSNIRTTNLRFEPNSKAQKEFMESIERQILYSGSFGAGKSRAGNEKGHKLNCRYPGNRGLIVRKSLVDVRASTINQSLLEHVIPESHIIDHNKGDCVIRHHTGTTDPSGEPVISEIHYYGLTSGEKTSSDDLPRKIGSTEYGWIFLDEGTEAARGEWNQLLGRLRYDGKRQNGYYYPVPVQQIFTATNPDSPNHWMHDYFGLDGGAPPGREFWMASLKDNQDNVPDEYVEDLETSLSGMYYERYFEGKWVGAEGMVYDEYDPKKHLLHPNDLNTHFGISPDAPDSQSWQHHGRQTYDEDDDTSHFVTPPENWRIYRAIDFGYRNPFVCQYWARSPDNELIMFREIYKVETIIDDLVPLIKSMTPEANQLSMTVADHDAENHEQLRQKGISTANANKAVESGIQDVKERLMLDARGRPSLYFMQGARCHAPESRLKLDEKPLKTLDEIYDYEYDEDEEEPIKENDHGMDTLRYLVHTLDSGPQMTLEEMEEWDKAVNESW